MDIYEKTGHWAESLIKVHHCTPRDSIVCICVFQGKRAHKTLFSPVYAEVKANQEHNQSDNQYIMSKQST